MDKATALEWIMREIIHDYRQFKTDEDLLLFKERMEANISDASAYIGCDCVDCGYECDNCKHVQTGLGPCNLCGCGRMK